MMAVWEVEARHVCVRLRVGWRMRQINIKTTGNHVILLTRRNQAKVLGLDPPLLAFRFNFQIDLI